MFIGLVHMGSLVTVTFAFCAGEGMRYRSIKHIINKLETANILSIEIMRGHAIICWLTGLSELQIKLAQSLSQIIAEYEIRQRNYVVLLVCIMYIVLCI